MMRVKAKQSLRAARKDATGPERVANRRALAFADVLDAAEQLDATAQAELVAVLSRRLAENGRKRIIANVKQGRREFAKGEV